MSKRSKSDNPRGGDAAWDRRKAKAGSAVMNLDRLTHPSWSGEIEIVSFRLRLGQPGHEENLVVVQGVNGSGEPVVAFHSADEASDALVGAINRVLNGQLRWKADEYKAGASS